MSEVENPPAFPRPVAHDNLRTLPSQDGMTLRDYFAIHAPAPDPDTVATEQGLNRSRNPHNDAHKPRLLDLFCCAGGAAMGYHRAGFEVVGIDINPQPLYPFEFIQDDVIHFLSKNVIRIQGFDAIHASPPCQGYTWAAKRWKDVERAYLVDDIRTMLDAIGKPYVIENVPGAPLRDPIRLCGEMFGLNVIRHRNFETNWPLRGLKHTPHRRPIKREARDGSGRTVQRSVYCCVAGHGGEGDSFRLEDWQAAMGIDWMDKAHLVEAIPPAYTQFIGEQLLTHIEQQRLAA